MPSDTVAGVFLRLPPELIGSISSWMDNRDIGNLRLANKALSTVFKLRIRRVFLSANSRNVQVFRAIAEHEVYRHLVREIVWDDALLLYRPDNYGEIIPFNGGSETPRQDCPNWFYRARKKNVEEMINRATRDNDIPQHIEKRNKLHAPITAAETWTYYQSLLRDQDVILLSNSDIEAFRYGLKRFQGLQRITITPATHGALFIPLYHTPMIRQFPYGFNYPLPRGWPHCRPGEILPDVLPWESNDETPYRQAYGLDYTAEKYRERWRGFRAITRILVQENYALQELVIDTRQILTGLNCFIFQQACEEYDNLCHILSQPGLRRLDLPLFVNGIEHEQFRPYRTGLLFNALAQAKELEHFSLSTSLEYSESGSPNFLDVIVEEHFVSLGSVIPIDKWSNLRHFGLSQFLVLQSDLLLFLKSLPRSTCSIDLSFLMFIEEEGGRSYRDLLNNIRQRLEWQQRLQQDRPELTIAVYPKRPTQAPGKALWIARDVIHEFLYEEGKNPFGVEGDYQDPNMVLYGGMGAVRDEFEPTYERPWETISEMEARGVPHRRVDWNYNGDLD